MDNGNEPAMPIVEVDFEGDPITNNLGLTKREDLIARAMQGLCSISIKPSDLLEMNYGSSADANLECMRIIAENIARRAVIQADAVLKVWESNND